MQYAVVAVAVQGLVQVQALQYAAVLDLGFVVPVLESALLYVVVPDPDHHSAALQSVPVLEWPCVVVLDPDYHSAELR